MIAGFEPDPNASKEPIKQGQGRQQRNSTPRTPKPATSSSRSGNNSFGPRRTNQNNDRRPSNNK